MLGHLLLEDLLEDGLHAFPDPSLHVPLYGSLELLLRGQVFTSSLNPQLTRHYLAGIGFTMSLFIGGLAFEEGGLLYQAKLGLLAASVLAAGLGLALLGWGVRSAADPRG